MTCTTLLCGKPAEYVGRVTESGWQVAKCALCYSRSFENDLVPINPQPETPMSNQAQHLRKKPLTRHELQELQDKDLDDDLSEEPPARQCGVEEGQKGCPHCE